jgi:hypothetical protein
MFNLCCGCQYLGDKYSFPRPNDFVGIDLGNPCFKHYYCCCGDCERYREDVTNLEITECECFDAI